MLKSCVVPCSGSGATLLILFLIHSFTTVLSSSSPPILVDFQNTRYIFKPEDQPINSTIGTITAKDSDGPGELVFSIIANTGTDETVRLGPPRGSSLTGRTVDIILIKELDRDRGGSPLDLYFSIADGAGNQIRAVISVYIQDINDEAPAFKNLRYKVSISEAAAVGTTVQTVTATDLDSGQAGTVTYSMQPATQGASDEYRNAFVIRQESTNTGNIAHIVLNSVLDYETYNFYDFILKATDGGNVHTGTADFLITLEDVQDTPPSFINQPYSRSVDESVPTGTSVLQVTALDGDRGIPNKVEYSLVGGDSTLFTLDSTTGWITVKSQLDRDSAAMKEKGGVYELTVKATEQNTSLTQNFGNTTATTQVTIRVNDVNDNPPTFQNNTYIATVLENMQQGAPITFTSPQVMQVSDIDQGRNNHFSLSLEKNGQPYTVMFTQPNEVYGQSSVTILVNNQAALDFETNPLLTFQIVAREIETSEKRSATATVTVNIQDMNDNEPQFDQDSYTADVKENSVSGTSVTTLTATDDDTGLFGNLTYSLRGGNNRFSIDSQTGVVSVSGDLDREKIDEYYLTVEAKDGGGYRTPVELVINVTDDNDNSPAFRRSEYYGTVKENSLTFLRGPLVVDATDLDKVNTVNSQISYTINRSPDGLTDNFTIDASSGAITLTDKLDYESLDPGLGGQVWLEIEARDGGQPSRSSFINATIDVEDENDMTPKFNASTYSSSIPENATSGTPILQVFATDLDGTSLNNEILYRIDSGAADKFRINFQTGEITVEVGAKLDRETKDSYDLTVTATDRGRIQKQGQCHVTITITDINDEPPTFNPETSTGHISEHAGTGTSVITVTAQDQDSDKDLAYSILSQTGYDEKGKEVNSLNYFSVDPSSGRISVASSLDRETAETIVLHILVEDQNAWRPSGTDRQTATATVTITLDDYNDNAPEFVPTPQYVVNVSESQTVDFEVLQVETTDKDKNQQATYTLQNEQTLFTIESNTGILRLKNRLDRETRDHLEVKIVATDNGVTPGALSSTATVSVNVLDINDNNPVFDHYSHSYEVSEDANIGDIVATITATDKDSGEFERIVYSMAQDDERRFEINHTTGVISVAKALNREEKSSYTVTVTAVDNPNNPFDQRTNRTDPITINVEDVNDNSPVFTNIDNGRPPKVFENEEIGNIVFTVTADDADAGKNARLDYSLGGNVTVLEKFEIITGSYKIGGITKYSGDIKVKGELLSMVGRLNMTVTATDNGDTPRSTSSDLILIVQDVNLHPPVFTHPARDRETINWPEEQDPGTTIFTVKATDADHGQNALLNFTLLPEGDWEKFNIGLRSGVLTNKVKLDREVQRTYEIKIKAEDNGQPAPRATTRTMIINLLDVDDQLPEFPNARDAPYLVFMEEEQMGASSTQSLNLAEDKDQDLNYTVVYYYIISGEAATEEYLSLDRLGNLTLKKPIDREAPQIQASEINFIVQADPLYKTVPFETLPSNQIPPAGYRDNKTLLWVRLKIEDINDNPPVFVQSVITLGITRDTGFGTFIFNLQEKITDKDATRNVTFTYLSFEDHVTNNRGVKEPFKMFKNGSIKTNTYFQSNMYGYYLIGVMATEKRSGGLEPFTTNATFRISLINDDQRVKVVFRKTPEEVRSFSVAFQERLQNVTGYRIVVDKIQTHENDFGFPEVNKTDMFIHAEDLKTNETIPAKELLRIIDNYAEALLSLRYDYKILEIVPLILYRNPFYGFQRGSCITQPTVSELKEETLEDTFKLALILVAIILTLLSVGIMVLFYLSTQKYRRKLRAATSMAFDSSSDLQKLEMPGTNLHAYENVNPIYMEKVVLETTGEHADDVDLDDNVVDPSQVNPYSEMEVSMNFYGEDNNSNQVSKSTIGDQYLKAALDKHEETKSKVQENGKVSNGTLESSAGGTTLYSKLHSTEI